MRLFLAAALAAFAAAPVAAENICAAPKANADITAVSWLAGNWIQDSGGRIVRERWSGPFGGALFGVGVTTKGETAQSFEFFRIAPTPAGLTYFASPNATAPTPFTASEICAAKVVFENKTHDFPQRVIYAKGPNGTLKARVEGTLNGKSVGEEWTYRPDR